MILPDFAGVLLVVFVLVFVQRARHGAHDAGLAFAGRGDNRRVQAELLGISRRTFHLIFSLQADGQHAEAGYRQVLCANSFTSLAELSLHRAGKPALNYLVAEDRERVKGGEAACEALDVSSVFCYQPASSSCISMCFMLMYFFPPHWVPAT